MPARHRVVAQLIQRSIARGQLSAAGVLCLSELAQRFGRFSTEDLQLALARLQSEGLIEMRGDLDPVVRESPMLTHVMSTPAGASHEASLPRDEIFSDGARLVGLTATGRSETTAEPASLDVADQLEIAVRTPIVRRQTVRYAGDEPAALENAYYPHDIVAPADPAADVETIIDAVGYRRVGWIDAVVARLANPDEATVLGLDTGSPVIDHTRVLYSRKGGEQVRPVEYVRTLFVGNRHRLTYEYKQPDA